MTATVPSAPLHIDPIIASRTDDRARIRAVLQRDPITAAYLLGDLDPVYAHYCEWWVAEKAGADVAVVLVYTGLSAPVVLTYGQTDGLAAIFSDHLEEIPQRAFVHLLPEHLAVVDQHFHLERMRPMVRMGLQARQFRPNAKAVPATYAQPERLTHRDTGDIMALFQYYPDSFFEPHQLTAGHYYGIRTSDAAAQLVAVAGIHVVSKIDRIATLGNIVTHPDHRGAGLSTCCTCHLVSQLIDEGTELLALNVERRNSSAMHIYEKLGFREHITYIEAFLVRTLSDRAKSGRVKA